MMYFVLRANCKLCGKELPEQRTQRCFCSTCIPPIHCYGKKYDKSNYKPGDYIHFGRERTRELVRKRDNYTCQDCKKVWVGLGHRRFDVHHLNGMCGKLSRSYDKVENLATMITLCHKCHFNRPEHTSKKLKKRL